jgi:ADP-ribose pyrophosphatase YjhB (NUDIX family)
MKRPGDLSHSPYLDLRVLLGQDTGVPIHHTLQQQSFTEFEKQASKINELGSNARSLGILLLRQGMDVALVQRTGTHPGWALPSGSVQPGESFRRAFHREIAEEIDVTEPPKNVRAAHIEKRIFEAPDGRKQFIYVAMYVGHLANDQEIKLTEAGTQEGIVAVAAHPLKDLPADMAFGDDQKITDTLRLRIA